VSEGTSTTRRPVFGGRKNTVYRVDDRVGPAIVKVFSPERGDLAKKEFQMLEECIRRGIRVPKPLELRGLELYEECIEGTNASAVVDSVWSQYLSGDPASRESVKAVIDGVADWLAGFHRAFAFHATRGDSILKNFIIGPDGSVTGIDFEESVLENADSLDDLGELCSYVMSMHPAFSSEKISLASAFADRYWALSGIRPDHERLSHAVAKALRHYGAFRADGDVMVQWALRLESGETRL